MSAQVRVFAYPGLSSIPLAPGGTNRPANDSLYVLTNPYLGKANLTADTGAAVTTDAAVAPAKTACLQVQVQPGKSVHYEVTPASHTLREATTDSPIIRGDTIISFYEGYRVSFLEATES